MIRELSAARPPPLSASRHPLTRSCCVVIAPSPPRKPMRRCPSRSRCSTAVARALVIVGSNIRQRAADHAAHRDDGGNCVRPLLGDRPGIRAARRAYDDAGDVVLAQRTEHLRLTIGVLIGVGEDRGETEMIERILDAGRQLGEKGIVEIADDHPDEVGRGGAQARRAAMIDVAERLHGAIDPLRACFGATSSLPDRTSETVDLDTPARRATSTIVTRPARSPVSSRPIAPDIALPCFWNVPNIDHNDVIETKPP